MDNVMWWRNLRAYHRFISAVGRRFVHLIDFAVVERLDVLPKGRRISVAFLTSVNLAYVRLVVEMRSTVLEPITGVAVSLRAARESAPIRFF
jgi:hypothetical protein